MGGVPPKAFVTDQDPAITKAVSVVFPDTKNIYCAWHIHKKFPEKLQTVDQQYPQFRDLFIHLIRNTEDAQLFEMGWAQLMQEYGLTTNEWLQGMYNVREKWVPAYTKGVFLAGMTTTQRSESINAFFDHFVRPKTKLLEFVEAYERAITKRREDEKDADCKSTYGTPVLKTKYAVEEQIAKLYTREIFYEFQVEIESSQYYMPKSEVGEDTSIVYEIHKYGEPDYKRKVTWCEDTQVSTCTCRLFVWCGIVCRHVLSMFRWRGIIAMPQNHLLRRWTQRPKERSGIQPFTRTSDATNSPLVRRHAALPKINFILHELTSNRESFQIANAGLDNIITALWEHKQSQLLAGCSAEERLAITLGDERRTSHDSNRVGDTNGIHGNTTVIPDVCLEASGVRGNEASTREAGPVEREMEIQDPHVVKAKGRSSKRMKSSLEKATARPGRLCRGCKKIVVGHDRRNCPELRKSNGN